MKLYLVAYKTGDLTIESCVVETPDNYTPRSDNMKLLRYKIWSSNYNLNYKKVKVGVFSSYVEIETQDKEIKENDIKIISVSNLSD